MTPDALPPPADRTDEDRATRTRRGIEVTIPPEWVGKVTHPQSVRKRPSKQLHKLRKWAKHGHDRVPKRAERSGMVGDA